MLAGYDHRCDTSVRCHTYIQMHRFIAAATRSRIDNGVAAKAAASIQSSKASIGGSAESGLITPKRAGIWA